MTVTVLGGSGFIGHRLAAELRRRGTPAHLPARDDGAWRDRPLGHVIYAVRVTADVRRRLVGDGGGPRLRSARARGRRQDVEAA